MARLVTSGFETKSIVSTTDEGGVGNFYLVAGGINYVTPVLSTSTVRSGVASLQCAMTGGSGYSYGQWVVPITLGNTAYFRAYINYQTHLPGISAEPLVIRNTSGKYQVLAQVDGSGHLYLG